LGRITIKEIAKKANVSVSVVSYALNDSGYVKKDTKEKIKMIARENNYVPSHIARAIRTRKTKTIALVVPSFIPGFYELVKSIESSLSEKGYCLVLFNTKNDLKRELQVIEIVKERIIDGIIISGVFGGDKNQDIVEKIQGLEIPSIFFDRIVSGSDLPYVAIDNYLGGKTAGDYLIKNGHKDIAALLHNTDIEVFAKRREGFIDALSSKAIKPVFEAIVPSKIKVIEEYLKENIGIFLDSKITAVFASTDLIAINLISILNGEGIKVPEDISVMGYDNILFSRYIMPKLTTIDHKLEKIGKIVADNLVNKLEKGKFHKKRIIIRPEIVIRDSVKKINL
jgi:DNA-binding LacI/PurR family transcriptional regulator